MIDLSIRFNEIYHAFFFLALASLCALWAGLCLRKNERFLWLPAILVNAIIFISWGLLVGIDHDESSHLHNAWMMSQGLIPFKDFWLHHSPFLQLFLAPLIKMLAASVIVFDLSRILSGAVFVLIIIAGWRLARRVLGSNAQFSLYLLIISSSAVLGEFLWLRPDLFLTLFLLLGINQVLEINGNRLRPFFLSGIYFGIAYSFMCKQYLMILLPIILIYLETEKGSKLKKLSAYGLGLVTGAFPLLAYLFINNILKEFIFWVFWFNGIRVQFSAYFALAVGIIGSYGAAKLFNLWFKFKDKKAFTLFIAFCLCTLSSLSGTGYPSSGIYYLGFWYVLCAVTGCGVKLNYLTKGKPVRYSLIAGFFIALLIFQNLSKAVSHRPTRFGPDKEEAAQLMAYSAKGECFVILPMHPVFMRDSTRLYSYWQYKLANKHACITRDVKDIAGQVINSRPVLISATLFNKKDLLLELFQKKLITASGYGRLSAFIKDNYTIKKIGLRLYYVRNDSI